MLRRKIPQQTPQLLPPLFLLRRKRRILHPANYRNPLRARRRLRPVGVHDPLRALRCINLGKTASPHNSGQRQRRRHLQKLPPIR